MTAIGKSLGLRTLHSYFPEGQTCSSITNIKKQNKTSLMCQHGHGNEVYKICGALQWTAYH